MSKINIYKVKNNVYFSILWIEKNLWAISLVVSTAILFVLIFTNWRPFYSDYPDRMNYILETFCFGIFISSIFYLINEFIPESQIRFIKRSQNKRELHAIRQNIRYVYICARPFCFNIEKLSEEEYVEMFLVCDLLGREKDNQPNIEERIQLSRDKIIMGCEKVLASPITCNSIKDVEYVKAILTSYFVSMNFNPRIFVSEDDYLWQYDDNQEEIGREIYKLYHL